MNEQMMADDDLILILNTQSREALVKYITGRMNEFVGVNESLLQLRTRAVTWYNNKEK